MPWSVQLFPAISGAWIWKADAGWAVGAQARMVFSDNTQLTKREQEVEAAKVLTLLDRNNDGMLDFVSRARTSCTVQTPDAEWHVDVFAG